jgi:hypothetical protein
MPRTSPSRSIAERTRRGALVALRAAVAALAVGSAAATQPAQIDIVRIDPKSGQMTLCVVLDEPVDNRRAIDRLRHRLNTGARYARSGAAYDEHPEADRLLPFRLAVIAKTPVSPIERQNLDGIRLQYRYTDIRFDVEGVEPGRRAPVGN